VLTRTTMYDSNLSNLDSILVIFFFHLIPPLFLPPRLFFLPYEYTYLSTVNDGLFLNSLTMSFHSSRLFAFPIFHHLFLPGLEPPPFLFQQPLFFSLHRLREVDYGRYVFATMREFFLPSLWVSLLQGTLSPHTV